MSNNYDEQRRARAEQLTGIREQRDFRATFELRNVMDSPDEVWAEILASVTETPYEIGDPDKGGYVETIARGAFKRSVESKPKMVLLAEHAGLPLSSTTGGSLFLEETERGLKATAPMDATDPDVDRVVRKIRRGDLTGASFSFRATSQDWSSDGRARRITGVELTQGDISFCALGANPAASVALRAAELAARHRPIPDFTTPAVARLRAMGVDVDARRRAVDSRSTEDLLRPKDPTDYYLRRVAELRRAG